VRHFPNKTTNIPVLGLFARLQNVLAAEDADSAVVDLDRVDNRTKVRDCGQL
jgi:hypothetical protein